MDKINLTNNGLNNEEVNKNNDENLSNEKYFSEQFRALACKLTMLNEREKTKFFNVLQDYRKLFSNKPGCARGYEHRIRLIRSNPIINRTYPVPLALRDAVGKCIKQMLDAGVIEIAISPFCNPLRIVKKSDGTVRICLDARHLNTYVEDDHESPPIISELMQKFYGARILSKIDLTQGYWQIPLHKESRPCTAFLFGSTMYQFCRVPFGLKTAGSAFIRTFSMALESSVNVNKYCERDIENKESDDDVSAVLVNKNEIKETEISTYIDDTVIASRTFNRHIKILKIIFMKLLINNFTLRLEKCEFFQEKLYF